MTTCDYNKVISAINEHTAIVHQLNELYQETTINTTKKQQEEYNKLRAQQYEIECVIKEEVEKIPSDHHVHIVVEQIWSIGSDVCPRKLALKKALIDVLMMLIAKECHEEELQSPPSTKQTEGIEDLERLKDRNLNESEVWGLIEKHTEVVDKIDILLNPLTEKTEENKKTYQILSKQKEILDEVITAWFAEIEPEHYIHVVVSQIWHGMPIKNTKRDKQWKKVLGDILAMSHM